MSSPWEMIWPPKPIYAIVKLDEQLSEEWRIPNILPCNVDRIWDIVYQILMFEDNPAPLHELLSDGTKETINMRIAQVMPIEEIYDWERKNAWKILRFVTPE